MLLLSSSYLPPAFNPSHDDGGRTRLLWIALLHSLLAFSSHCSAAATDKASKKVDLKSPSDYLVTGLEDVESTFKEFDGTMYAGMVPFVSFDDKSNAEYMFWMFEPTKPQVDDTVVIWLNGGPGCSSSSSYHCSPSLISE